MADGDVALGKMIKQLRVIGKDIRRMVAAEAAPLVEKAVLETAHAGTDPYGNAWAPTKKGERAMPNAATAITVTPRGTSIEIRVTGGEAIENSLKEGRRRQVIPSRDKGLPPALAAALDEACSRAFQKVMSQ